MSWTVLYVFHLLFELISNYYDRILPPEYCGFPFAVARIAGIEKGYIFVGMFFKVMGVPPSHLLLYLGDILGVEAEGRVHFTCHLALQHLVLMHTFNDSPPRDLPHVHAGDHLLVSEGIKRISLTRILRTGMLSHISSAIGWILLGTW